MIRQLFILLLCVLTSGLVSAAAPIKAPKPLMVQVERLTELLRDSYAVGYPDATMVQLVKGRENRGPSK